MDFAAPDINFDTSPISEFDFDDDHDDEFDDSDLDVVKSDTIDMSLKEDSIEMALVKVRCPMEKRSAIMELINNALINENDIKVS